jgi:uncharacterized protein YukE
MSRPADWHNLDLDSDPTPGDVHAIRAQGHRFQTFADDVASVHRLLNNAAKDQALAEWNGKAAEAFRGQIGKLPGQLSKLHKSYGAAGDALVAFAGRVESEQSAADGALAKARILRGDLTAKQAELGRAKDAASSAGSAEAKLDGAGSGRGSIPPDQISKIVLGTAKGFVTSVTKETVNSAVFGRDFNPMSVMVGTASGAGDAGVGYQPGLRPASPLRR